MRRWAGGAALVLASATILAFLLVRPPSPLAAADRLFDAVAFRLFAPPEPADPRVVILAITPETLAAFPYVAPIDRGFLAGLIDTLAGAGAAAVGLDVLFDRPTEPEKDAALRQALARPDIPVVAITVAPETDLPPEQRRFLEGFLAMRRTALANLGRDRFDDMVRTHVPVHPATGQLSLPASLAAVVGMTVPTAPFPILWRPAGTLPVYPAEAAALLPPHWLAGRVVLVGSMIPGIDEHRTLASAFGRPSFGVEIHAAVLAQMLEGRAVPPGPCPGCVATLAAATLGTALGGMLAGAAAAAALTLTVLLIPAAALAAVAAGLPGVSVAAPVLACLLAGALARIWRGHGERRDRRTLRVLFSRFVSEPVVAQILAQRELFLAGGRPVPQQLTATVLFCDVAGFTSLCERLPPAPLVAWLDRYIEAMVAVVAAHEGVVLRFVGDGILAVFGAPVPRHDAPGIATDARNAVRCGLGMEAEMDRLNAAWREAGLPAAGLRVGIHTGPLVAGSFGSGTHMEFCLLGDTANVAARLEQLGKQQATGPCGCTILVGGPTWERLGKGFAGRPVGEIALRGRQAAISVWRVDRAAQAQAEAEAATLPLPRCSPASPGRAG
ncbi:adenylate/guanylate cyclase domain-containing protein [Rhodovastum atsumiense]|nr:adenylate/guanylate cyclase domain-containing protein [Rhodovastum atsumiense]